jgi:LPXTG-site transpeptidase (sortase) family protein
VTVTTTSATATSPAAETTTTTTLPPSLRFTISDEPVPASQVRPTLLRIDGIEIEAPVDPYGVDRQTGEMDVPSNVRDVAWYQYGPSPGEPGSAVLAAHVDLASQGAGVFFRLDELETGDLVEVEYEDGSVQQFEVAARVRYDKAELPLDVIFARNGPPVLTLITCGGGFNPSIQSYDSNVVVYAFPVDAEIR